MHIFILEDNKVRIELFKERFAGHDLTIKEDADSAIEYLSNGLVDSIELMLLDHDLGNRAYVSVFDDNTGSRVAKFIREQGIKVPTIVHSLNYPGAKNIISILPWANYCPGIWLKGEYSNFEVNGVKL